MFWRWFAYALWQGILLILVSFMTMNGTVTPKGVDSGCLELDG